MFRQKIILLVFIAIFGTVAPEMVLGEETVYVQNFVTSSSHSGGYTSKGTDGVDGQDGEDGKPGQDGEDVYSVSASEGASIELHSVTVNGQSETFVFSSTTGSGEVDYETSSEDWSDPDLNKQTNKEITADLTSEQRSQLFSIIQTLQELIKRYVNVLF